jgi:spermidine/putrescine transport system permease protein
MTKINYGKRYSLPLLLWVSFFFVVPTSIVFLYSFLQRGIYGGVEWHFSLDAYTALFNPVFLQVVWRTLEISLTATVVMVVLALPTAYFIARSKHKQLWLFLIIIPFWTNLLIRVYAWIAILGNNGFLNNLLLSWDWIKEPLPLLYNQTAITLVTIYTYLPYAILPLYSSIEKFDFSLLEAARDLGATTFQSIRKVLLPNIQGGVKTAVLFTFIPVLGSYAIPQLVGGTDSTMLGNIIAHELTVTRNWPLASSISLVLTVVTMIFVFAYMRKVTKNDK